MTVLRRSFWRQMELCQAGFLYLLGRFPSSKLIWGTLHCINTCADQKESRNKKQHHSLTKNLKMWSHSNHTQVVRSSAMLLSCRVRLPGVGALQGFSAPAGRCSSGLMLRCTLASRGSSRSLHSSMRAAFAVVLMGSVHLMKLFRCPSSW